MCLQRQPLPPELLQGIKPPPLRLRRLQGKAAMGHMMSRAAAPVAYPAPVQPPPLEDPAAQAAWHAHAHTLLHAKMQALEVAVPPQLMAEVDALAQQLLASLPHVQARPYHEVTAQS